MKRFLFLLIFSIGTSTSNAAQDLSGGSGCGVSLVYGQSIDGIDIYRAGLLKQWNVKWLENKTGYVRGYFELSYNRWENGRDDVNAVALSPVFQYVFHVGNVTWYPYIEAGIGAACLAIILSITGSCPQIFCLKTGWGTVSELKMWILVSATCIIPTRL